MENYIEMAKKYLKTENLVEGINVRIRKSVLDKCKDPENWIRETISPFFRNFSKVTAATDDGIEYLVLFN